MILLKRIGITRSRKKGQFMLKSKIRAGLLLARSVNVVARRLVTLAATSANSVTSEVTGGRTSLYLALTAPPIWAAAS